MDRRRVIGALALAAVALALCLSGINTHGLWFDEAYTARIAALAPDRVLRGATADIHPPGWPLISALALRLPLAPEVALRLPSTLAFCGLIAWLGLRGPLRAVAALACGPLLDQATQGRPYMALALGLVLCSEALARGRWGLGGLAAGVVASLHALGGARAAPVVLVHLARGRPGWRAVASLLGGGLLVTVWWIPAFVAQALFYLGDPWYTPSDPRAWWVITDGWPGLVGLGLWMATRSGGARAALLPGLAALAALVALELLQVGVEIRKVGVVVLPLLLSGTRDEEPGRRSLLGQVGLALGLALGGVHIDARPDLREAAEAVRALDAPVPVLSVFASEAAWYLRAPAPLPSGRDPDEIRRRLADALRSQQRACVCALSLPGSFPERLPDGTRVIAVADVTGLDVRLVGTSACEVAAAGPIWHLSPS